MDLHCCFHLFHICFVNIRVRTQKVTGTFQNGRRVQKKKQKNKNKNKTEIACGRGKSAGGGGGGRVRNFLPPLLLPHFPPHSVAQFFLLAPHSRCKKNNTNQFSLPRAWHSYTCKTSHQFLRRSLVLEVADIDRLAISKLPLLVGRYIDIDLQYLHSHSLWADVI